MQSDETTLAAPIDEIPYTMRISRLTIDKLGVKLYDKVSAVVAELIANSYDADAEKVTIKLPLNTVLAKPKRKKTESAEIDSVESDEVEDYPEYEIVVEDNGHGMIPQEARDYFLITGRDRREIKGKGGDLSREKGRPVMGRKGIGKLAPFGVCRMIEVISAGGEKTENGYLVSHFFMDYDKIVTADDSPAVLNAGEFDNTYFENCGTTIRLTNFLPKRVPDSETIHRQLAARFVFADPKFRIEIQDTRNPELNPLKAVESTDIPVDEDTKIDVSDRPVITEDGEILTISGWLAMGKNPYKHDELAGVRIYARNKIVAQTRDFGRKAGFTGEFYTRSYLVGDIRAEWLDEDEDLITSDRQRIIWDSDYGRALSDWGGEMIKEIAEKTFAPRRNKTKKKFLEVSNFIKRAEDRFENAEIVKVAVELAEKIGGFADSDELGSTRYIDELSEIILTVAPHKALIDAFQEFNKSVDDGEESVEQLVDLFDKTRISEMAMYARIASERVDAIDKLQHIVITEPKEAEFQKLLAEAPWLIEATWSVISENVALSTTKILLEKYMKDEMGIDVNFAVGFEDFSRKMPDFTLASIDGKLHIVEIKPSGHPFDDNDFERLANYPIAFADFFGRNEKVRTSFPEGWQITLIADGQNLKKSTSRVGFKGLIDSKQVIQITWTDFLLKAKRAHERFLNVAMSTKKKP